MKASDLIKNFIFAVTPFFLLVFFGEAILRAFHFQYSDTPFTLISLPEKTAHQADDVVVHELSMKALWKNWTNVRFIKDRNQFWVPSPPFFENSAKIEKDKDVFRIATLGCSCTMMCMGTLASYPSLMEEGLKKQTGKKIEVLNAGVGAYSSYQGLQRLKFTVLKYHPNLVTIYFGWNDHWFARCPDKQIRIKSNWEVELINFFEQSRLYQAYHYLLNSITRTRYDQLVHPPSEEQNSKNHLLIADPLLATEYDSLNRFMNRASIFFRVPIEDYEKNLKEMVGILRNNQIQPVLITAPANYPGLGSSEVWPFEASHLVLTHITYNRVVRRVAEAEKVPLVDLDTILNDLSPQEKTSIFSDSIHFTPQGCQKVADIISNAIRQYIK